jgi:hypothetical protein
VQAQKSCNLPAMYFGDTVRTGVPFSKDPHVIWFQGKYLMYYSVPAYKIKMELNTVGELRLQKHRPR